MNSNSQPSVKTTEGRPTPAKQGYALAAELLERAENMKLNRAPTPDVAQVDVLTQQNAALLAACKAAADYLAKIPAFGDTIGSDVSKAQLGVALNQLRSAIALAQEGK